MDSGKGSSTVGTQTLQYMYMYMQMQMHHHWPKSKQYAVLCCAVLRMVGGSEQQIFDDLAPRWHAPPPLTQAARPPRLPSNWRRDVGYHHGLHQGPGAYCIRDSEKSMRPREIRGRPWGMQGKGDEGLGIGMRRRYGVQPLNQTLSPQTFIINDLCKNTNGMNEWRRIERVGLASFPADAECLRYFTMVANDIHIETILSRDSVPLNWILFALKSFLWQIFCLFSTILEHLIP